MDTIFWVSAVVGCTLVGLQVVLQVFGMFGDMDFDHADVGDAADGAGGFDAEPADHGNLFFGILSFKSLCAFVGIFGLVGLLLANQPVTTRVLAAGGAGFVGMIVVVWLMRSVSKLQASGTVRIANAVGRTGTVYLRIPGKNEGHGKVTVEIQGRTLELDATTDGDEIPTGRRVSVISVESDETLKVVPV